MRTFLAGLCFVTLPVLPALSQSVGERLPTCLSCHGANGHSNNEGVPSLGGMPADYVMTHLYLFREKQRIAEPMNDMAAGLSDRYSPATSWRPRTRSQLRRA